MRRQSYARENFWLMEAVFLFCGPSFIDHFHMLSCQVWKRFKISLGFNMAYVQAGETVLFNSLTVCGSICVIFCLDFDCLLFS